MCLYIGLMLPMDNSDKPAHAHYWLPDALHSGSPGASLIRHDSSDFWLTSDFSNTNISPESV